jgi:hypothetical protein
MKSISLILTAAFAAAMFASCDDDTVCVCPDPVYTVTGRALYRDSMDPAADAIIYHARNDDYYFTDTTGTDERGAFRLEGSYQGDFSLFAAVVDGPPGSSSFSHVSPIPGVMDNTGLEVFCAGDKLLNEVFDASSVKGYKLDETGMPAGGADVDLYHRGGGDPIPPMETLSDSEGRYSFTDVPTGNYIVFAHNHWGEYGESDIFFCDGLAAYEADTVYLEEDLIIEKPAIYIYPDSDRRYEVILELAEDTELTASIPEYGSGWDVFVETTGLIDHEYDYLFYEASIQEAPEFNSGWCFDTKDLEEELTEILISLGLNLKETEDFLDHWLGRLTEYEYYSVYTLTGESLDRYVELRVHPGPDAILRFWLFFEGSSEYVTVPEFKATGFQRGSNTVVEWGGVLLN